MNCLVVLLLLVNQCVTTIIPLTAFPAISTFEKCRKLNVDPWDLEIQDIAIEPLDESGHNGFLNYTVIDGQTFMHITLYNYIPKHDSIQIYAHFGFPLITKNGCPDVLIGELNNVGNNAHEKELLLGIKPHLMHEDKLLVGKKLRGKVGRLTFFLSLIARTTKMGYFERPV